MPRPKTPENLLTCENGSGPDVNTQIQPIRPPQSIRYSNQLPPHGMRSSLPIKDRAKHLPPVETQSHEHARRRSARKCSISSWSATSRHGRRVERASKQVPCSVWSGLGFMKIVSLLSFATRYISQAESESVGLCSAAMPVVQNCVGINPVQSRRRGKHLAW